MTQGQSPADATTQTPSVPAVWEPQGSLPGGEDGRFAHTPAAASPENDRLGARAQGTGLPLSSAVLFYGRGMVSGSLAKVIAELMCTPGSFQS